MARPRKQPTTPDAEVTGKDLDESSKSVPDISPGKRKSLLFLISKGLDPQTAMKNLLIRYTEDDLRQFFPEFWALVEKAEAEFEFKLLSSMRNAALPHMETEVTKTTTTSADGSVSQVVKETSAKKFDWRAAESILKRRRAGRWGDKTSIDIDTEITDLLARLAAGEETTPAPETA